MNTDWHDGLPELQGLGVVLREPQRADAASLFSRLTAQNVAQFLATPPDSVQGFERFIDWVQLERQQGRHLCYAIFADGSPDAAGLIQVREIEPDFRTAEWGFALDRAHWGTGLFLRSAVLVLDYVFGVLGVSRLEARAMAENARANAVLRKLGAVEEGRIRPSFLLGGQSHDDVLWSILNADWLRRRSLSPTEYAASR